MRAFDHGLFKKILYKYQFREGVPVLRNFHLSHLSLIVWAYLNSIFSEELAYYATKKSADTNEAVPLTMKPFYAIFILSGIFYLMSLIVFLFEIIKKKLTTNNVTTKQNQSKQTPIMDSVGLPVIQENKLAQE